jgi:hypothetical protein
VLLVLAMAFAIGTPGATTAEEPGPRLQALTISTQHWVGTGRLILELLDAQDRPVVDPDAEVDLVLVSPSGREAAPVKASLGRWAVTGRDLYTAEVPFDEVGRWTVRVAWSDGDEVLAAETALTVLPDDGTPPLGSRAPDVDTPTLHDVGNLTDAISSDPRKVAAFYVKSVTDQLRSGQPFVLVLDSYAFQPNEACGGALGIVHDIFIEYPALPVIHAEPWVMRFAAGALTLDPPDGPARLAPWSEAYGLDEPPWVFVVDGEGRVRAKFQGIFGTDELRAAMAAVSTWRPLVGSPSPAVAVALG